jgi:ribonuclease P protein subunit RPR2
MAVHHRKKNKDLSKKIAEERIQRLFELAEQNFHDHPTRTHRYVTLARLISMRYRVRFTRDEKRKICKHCYHYLVPGNNCRIRLKGQTVLTTCLNCGKQSRYPYSEKGGSSNSSEPAKSPDV